MKTVLIVGRDWKFRALLRAQLREEGYDARAFETLQDAERETAEAAVLVFDTTDADTIWQAALQALAPTLPVVVVASATEELNLTPARILRRPLRLADIISLIRELAPVR